HEFAGQSHQRPHWRPLRQRRSRLTRRSLYRRSDPLSARSFDSGVASLQWPKSKLHCETGRDNISLMGRKRVEEGTTDLFSTEGVGGPSTDQAADLKQSALGVERLCPKICPGPSSISITEKSTDLDGNRGSKRRGRQCQT